jgi:predicted MFS family arabinose efflux permease
MKMGAGWFRRDRGLAIGVVNGALTVGVALPFLFRALGAYAGVDWRPVVVAASVAGVIGAALVGLTARNGPLDVPAPRFSPAIAAAAFREPSVRLASIGYFGHMWELFAMWTWFLLFFRDGHGAGGTEAAYATFAVIAVGGVGCIVGGLLAERIGRAEAAAAAMLVSGTCALVIGLLVDASTPLLLAFGLVWGFAVIADSALFSTLVTEYADQAYVGTALALQLAIGFALTAATIWLIPVLEEDFGWKWAFAFLAPGPILGVLAMVRLSSLQRRAVA